MSFFKRFCIEEDGQDMIEYGLVISLVVIGAAVSYQAFATQIGTALTTLGNTITNSL